MKTMMMTAVALSISAAFAPRAGAQNKPTQGVLQIGEITIVGRVQKPIAAVDVAKIQPKLTLAELRQPFLDRIEEAVHKDPF
jgi:type IV secretory pathway VirB2 component (pilin)